MPSYDYHCNKCDEIFEEMFVPITERDEIVCPVCKEKAERLHSPTGFVLKGAGWCRDGYQK